MKKQLFTIMLQLATITITIYNSPQSRKELCFTWIIVNINVFHSSIVYATIKIFSAYATVEKSKIEWY